MGVGGGGEVLSSPVLYSTVLKSMRRAPMTTDVWNKEQAVAIGRLLNGDETQPRRTGVPFLYSPLCCFAS